MTLDEAKKAMVKFVELKTTLRPAFVDPILKAEEVKHGRWKEHKDYLGLAYLCSDCGYFTTYRSYYCPYCGAQMEVEDAN